MRARAFGILTFLLIASLLSSPAQAVSKKVKISKPSEPTIVSITSKIAKKNKVNVLVVITLPASNGGSKITGSKILASGAKCTTKGLKTSCELKGIKSGKSILISATSKNKKGFGLKSAAVRITAGQSWARSTTQDLVTATPISVIPISSTPNPCTISGTAGDDNLSGTVGDDVICGLGGNDTIRALAGNDTIFGAEGNDTIFGAEGNDAIFGGAGDDELSGGPNVDAIDGGDGSNLCFGEDSVSEFTFCRYESSGPSITSVTASPSAISPGQTFTISIAASDPSGIDSVGFWFTRNDVQRDFCGQTTTQTSGTSTNGTWTYVCTVPALVLNGSYVITPYALDVLGSYTNTNGGTLSSTRGSITVTGGSDDETGPSIASVTATPSTVSPGNTLTISIAASDPSGIDSVGFWFTRNGVQRDFCGQTTTRTSGTSTNGTWTYVCTVPALVLNGSYVITPYAQDAFGSYTNTNGGTLSSTRGTVTVAGGSDDETGPTISSVTATPSTVSPGDTLTISIAASDPSGIDSVGFWFTRNGVQRDFCGQTTTRTSGTSTNGTWTYVCTVPANTVTGSYQITPYAMDLFGNYTNTNNGTISSTRGSFTLQ